MGLLDAPDAGEVWIGGQRVDDLPGTRRDRLRNTAIGMVFQAYHLLPELDALENVLAPLYVRHSLADISAARTAFGFDPKVGWEEGLRDTLRWYRS